MTPTDVAIARGIADLREQLEVMGVADPTDLARFLDLVESTLARTGELAPVLPLRRRSRSRPPGSSA